MNESAHERIENELPDLLLARWRRPLLRLHATLCPSCRAMLRRLELIDRLLRTTPPPQRPAHNLTTPRPAGGPRKDELSPPSAPRRKTSSATIQ